MGLSKSHTAFSSTMKMDSRDQRERRARRKVDGDADSVDAGGEMDNFLDLKLGSMTPVVRQEADSS